MFSSRHSATHPDLEPVPDSLRVQLGYSLGNAYRLERELGGGGMSRVFLATDATLERHVVVKLLSPELAAGMSADRFSREIKLAASLQEPHIVPVLSAGITREGLPYYTMPWVEGESLRGRLREGPVPPGEALSILRDVAHALAYAHSRGIVHRDIKPENVLLSSGTAVVTDFGIAKAIQASRTWAPGGPAGAADGALTQVGTSLGTPAYMSPEQAAADPAADHRADLYAWGVIAYELLTGSHPFAHRTTTMQLMAAHFGETPAPLGSSVQVSLPVRELVMRCLAKDASQRPASAEELLAVLDASSAAQPHRSLGSRLALLLVAIALIAGGVLAWRTRAGGVMRAEAAGPVMLAVLPFDNVGSAEQAAFTDGLTDALTAKLGALPSLAVIDRRSAAQYRQTTKPARQIGAELGVAYILEGVVRWAKDSRGNWRAQVTPTLVDARTGTTRPMGEPVVITPDDPFTAQGTIATKVAAALQVALRPTDWATLARRPTDSPDALAADQRGKAIFDGLGRTGTPSYDAARARGEFARAIALDSTYGEAWADLAAADYILASYAPGDRAAESRMRATLVSALAHAPGHPRLLVTAASIRLNFDRDTTGVESMMRRAMTHAPNDATVLRAMSSFAVRHRQYDSAFALLRRSAALDPRSARSLLSLGGLAVSMRKWNDARRYSSAVIAMDSSDERGWAMRNGIEYYRGDTLAMQRELARALRRIPHPSNFINGGMAYAGALYAHRYLALTPRELGVITLADTVTMYLDNKADVALRLGDSALAGVYYDSIRAVLAGRELSGAHAAPILVERALAEASRGQRAKARASLAQAFAAMPPMADPVEATSMLQPPMVAGVYGRLGEPDSAIHWLEMGLASPIGAYTARALALEPKLIPIRHTPQFQAFLRRHPD